MDETLCKHVEKHQTRILCICLRDDNIVVSGDQAAVDIFQSMDKDNDSVTSLVEQIKNLGHETNRKFSKEKLFKGSDQLPMMKIKYKAKGWNAKVARSVLTEWMSLLGYSSGGKKYGAGEEPIWWPDSESWESFRYPSYASQDVVHSILESICTHFNIDILSYHTDDRATINDDDRVSSSTGKRKSTASETRNAKKQMSREFLNASDTESEEDVETAKEIQRTVYDDPNDVTRAGPSKQNNPPPALEPIILPEPPKSQYELERVTRL